MSAGGMFLEIDEASWAHVQELLARFEGPAFEKVLRNAARAGARPYYTAMRGMAPVGPTGNLRGSIGIAPVRRQHGIAYVVAPLQRRGRMTANGVKGARKGYHRHLVVRGTAPHPIAARLQANRKGVGLRAALAAVAGGTRHALRFPSGELRFEVKHPGARPNPFPAKAAAANRDKSREAMVRAITRAARKAGISDD